MLDGGALLPQIPWPQGFPPYIEICDMYCWYVTGKYGDAIVVFDGYSELEGNPRQLLHLLMI